MEHIQPKSVVLVQVNGLYKKVGAQAKRTAMTIKSTCLIGLTFLFLSCGQQTGKNETQLTKSSEVEATIVETAKIDSITKVQTDQTVSSNQQELNKALTDPTIDNYYKEIYRQEKLISAEENKMLSITEELFTKDYEKDLFFFIVFTKSMNGSDGFYSEAVGLSAFEFVTKKTEWFADYFNIAPKLNEQDMDNWAQYVYGEIQISRENEEEKAVKELESQLLENIKVANKEYEIVIKRFIEKVKSTMP